MIDSVTVPALLEKRGLDRESLKRSFIEWLVYSVGKDVATATDRDWFRSVALAVRDRLVDNWMSSTRGYYSRDQKRVYYLSLEFLLGRLLTNSMANLGIVDACSEALADLGIDIDRVLGAEPDAALGNGGLGRLAACFLDSMATLGIAGYGYGIRYEYGLFQQRFEQGWQEEAPEDWLEFGNPWEFERAEAAYPVRFYGQAEPVLDGADGTGRHRWSGGQVVQAVAYDTPVVGYGGRSVNTLRLWSAKPTHEFDLQDFNRGDYLGAVEQKVGAETLSRVLYPNDQTEQGQELRFKQEYFFTAASLADITRRYHAHHEGWERLPDKVAIQLNDTHPAIAVPELMRLLVDEHGLAWGRAWEITRRTINYTNHTLLPEALETWPVRLVERVLPRHMQIIFEINACFLAEMGREGHDAGRIARLSLIAEGEDRRVRMGNLAFLGSRRVNGVSALHTGLMKTTVFRDLHETFPDRIVNKTNGITPRRWLSQANRPLSRLIDETIGPGWEADLDRLGDLEPHVEDAAFRARFAAAKRENKVALAEHLEVLTGLRLDPDALFDVQIKRIHEYKRQLLNLLQTVALWTDIRDRPTVDWRPVVRIFGGKAAPGYWTAKLIIKLANDIADTVNHDPAVRGLLKVAFPANYNVTLAEKIIPAADLSQQISTAGKEASGTGNMKLALNGALTVGTLDGANVEIRDRVGAENIYIFGLTADEAAALQTGGRFDPAAAIEADPRLKRAIETIESGVFSADDPGRFRPLMEELRHHDPYLLTADFTAYDRIQARIAADFAEPDGWMRRAARNTARVGWFSSDRTVREYAEEIWQIGPTMAEAAE